MMCTAALLLVEAGAALDAVDDDGKTACQVATPGAHCFNEGCPSFAAFLRAITAHGTARARQMLDANAFTFPDAEDSDENSDEEYYEDDDIYDEFEGDDDVPPWFLRIPRD